LGFCINLPFGMTGFSPLTPPPDPLKGEPYEGLWVVGWPSSTDSQVALAMTGGSGRLIG